MIWLRRFDAWWLPSLDAQPLAFFRIAVGLFAVVYLAARWSNLTSSAAFEHTQFDPVGVVSLADEPLAAWMVYALMALAILMGVAFTIGWRYAITGPSFAILLLWVVTYRNSWGQIYHSENLMVLHVLVLAIAPCADALSLDARRRTVVRAVRSSYGWPLRLCAVITVTTYVIAGWTKLDVSGLDWVTSDALRNHVAYDNLRKELLGDYSAPLGIWMIEHGWVFKPLAVATLIVELGAPLALFMRRLALIWVAAAWLFHVGVVATMMIPVFYPLLGLAFLPLFCWDGVSIVERIQRIAHAVSSWRANNVTHSQRE